MFRVHLTAKELAAQTSREGDRAEEKQAGVRREEKQGAMFCSLMDVGVREYQAGGRWP